jgi:pilus assembly protein Flp/PilA
MRRLEPLEFCRVTRTGSQPNGVHASCYTVRVLPRPASSPRLAATKLSLAALSRDERGAQMVEYIILVGVIAIAALAAFKTFGSQVRAKVDQQADTVQGVQGQ